MRLLIIFILIMGSLVSVSANAADRLPGDDCSSIIDISALINAGVYPQTENGDLTGMVNDYTLGFCSTFFGGGAEMVYMFTPDQDRELIFDLCDNSPGLADSVLYVREGGVCPGSDEVVCNDDGCDLPYAYMSVLDCTMYYTGVAYYLFVDAYSSSTTLGSFTLSITECAGLPTMTPTPTTTPEPATPSPGPGNDCSDAIDISSLINTGAYPQSVPGDLTDMTDDYALAACSGFGGGGPEMVYSFIPDQDRDLIFDLCDGSPGLSDSVLYIRTGGPCPGTSEHACDDDSCDSPEDYMSVLDCRTYFSDETYYLFVDAYNEYTTLGSFTLTVMDCTVPPTPTPVNTPTPPPGDSCGSALLISSVPFNYYYDNNFNLADGPAGSCDPFGNIGNMCNDFWFVWSPASDCFATLTATATGYNLLFVVWEGPSCVGLTEVICENSSTDLGNTEEASFQAFASETYWIQIGNTGDMEGGGPTDVTLICSTGPTPTPTDTPVTLPGDTCGNALDISSFINAGTFPLSFMGDLNGMNNDYALATCSTYGGAGAEMVYMFTLDQDRSLVFDLCDGSPGLSDSVLYVRSTGACPGSAEYACDDDGCDSPNDYMSSLDCKMYFSGVDYYLFVDSYSELTTPGDFRLSINACTLPPTPTPTVTLPGDTCDTAFTIDLDYDLPFIDNRLDHCTFSDACSDSDSSGCGSVPETHDDGYDIFYTFTAVTDRQLHITCDDNEGEDYGVIRVFEGCPCSGEETCLVYGYDDPSLHADFTLNAYNGVQYFIMIDSYPLPYCMDDFTLFIEDMGSIPTPTPTAVPVPIPASSPVSILILLVILGGVMAGMTRYKKT